MYVYLIRCLQTNFIKIGQTAKNPFDRMAELQTGCPFQLSLVAVYRHSESKLLEQFLHSHFKDVQYRSEWFQDSILETVDDVVKQWILDYSMLSLDQVKLIAMTQQQVKTETIKLNMASLKQFLQS